MKIVLEHLTKQFPPRGRKAQEPVTAVSDFNFEVPDGQLIGLLGPSGCGKSTTLNMICGLEKPTSGRILFGDDDVTSFPPERRGVGMVFQNYALYPHLTVKQNILFPLQNLKGKDKLSRSQMDERAQNAARLVQITELMDRRPSELSGGQQQRVAIARALVKMPRVLLLDEPLSNLDARLRLQTREEIRKIQRATKITTVFVTHDQEEALADDVYSRIQNVDLVTQESQNPYSYFTDELTEQVMTALQEKLGYTESQASNLLYAGGLSIYTTQDPDLQAIVDEEVNNPDNYDVVYFSVDVRSKTVA